jgi:hypothetical protein
MDGQEPLREFTSDETGLVETGEMKSVVRVEQRHGREQMEESR